MSAITGMINVHNKPISLEHVNSMMYSFRTFPSDDIQTITKDHVFLGCHAQWITPESVGEKLPYYHSMKKLAITADAIIDNRKELFEMLQIDSSLGKILPDSQVILLAYEKWGEACTKHLIGDFAFMIWDEKENKLFGARDFSGSRTLYYIHDKDTFAFSTIIETFFHLPFVDKKLNEEWLAEFIAIPNMVEAVDMNATVFQSIFQLPPAHCMTIKDGKLRLQRYCTIEVEECKLESNEEYEEAFREVFARAVSDRLRTNGEVGSHLSGGLDSGSVVSFAANMLKRKNKKLHTFSYIPEDDFTDWTDNYYVPDESPYIKETVDFVGNINGNFIDFKGISPLDEVDEFLNIMEMPYKFFSNSFWLRGFMEKASTKGIKLLLNGARGNHSISWGSMRLTYHYYVSLLKSLQWVNLNRELDYYCQNFRTGKKVMLPFIAKKAFPLLGCSLIRMNETSYEFPSFLNVDLAKKTNVYEKIQAYGMDISGAPVSNFKKYRKDYYNHLYVWNKSGVAGTKLSLRYGVWDRDPTNDIRVIKFCLAIPEEQYVTGGFERSIIRRATKNLLPDSVRLNMNRRGIQSADVIHRMAPHWESFMKEVKELRTSDSLAELIDATTLNKAITKLDTGPIPEHAHSDELKIVTRSLIINRFLKKNF